MVDQWFYSVGGKKSGPISYSELRELAVSGQLKPTDIVQRQGTRNWVAVLSVDGLIPEPEKVEGPKAASEGKSQDDILNLASGFMQHAVSSLKGQNETINKGLQDPILLAVASFLIPPLGQLLLGQKVKALVVFLVFPIVFVLVASVSELLFESGGLLLVMLPAYNATMAADAFLLGKKLKEGNAIGKWEFFAKWSPY